VVDRQNAYVADTLHPRDVALAITFWLSMGYNFGCMITRDTPFHSRCGFSGSSYPIMTADFVVLRNVAMASIFWLSIFSI